MTDKQILVENFLSLSILQIFSYLLPLFIYSYLVSVIGIEKFGLVFFVFAFIQFFIIFCDYGFDISEIKEIARNTNNNKILSHIFNSVLVLKLFLILLSFVVLLLFVFFVPKFEKHKLLYLMSFGMVIGSAIFPVWFFQGMERMKCITFFKLIPQIIFLSLILFFVKTEDSYLYIPLFNSISILIFGILGLFYAIKKFKIKLYFPKYRTIKRKFIYSSEFFISKMSLSLCTNFNTFVLGFVVSEIMLGIYVASEKIYTAIKGLQMPLHNVFYPYVSKRRNTNLYKKILKYSIIMNTILSFLLYYYSHDIILFLYGIEMIEAHIVLRLFAIIQLIAFPSIMIGYPLLGAFGHTKEVNESIIKSLPVYFIILIILYITKNLNIYSICCATLLFELVIFLYRLFFCFKYHFYKN